MDPVRYNALVARLEETAEADPGALRRRVVGLIALAYGYVFVVLLAVLAAIALTGFAIVYGHAGALAKVAFALVALAWVIAKSLWVRAESPQGTQLVPGSAPKLEARVEEIRAALDAPRADVVLLTDDFNASVTQIPRLGIFGWPRTYLTLGIPLLYAVDARQLDAVLAHEFGHLSGAHPKLGLWVYRMSRTWRQLLANVSRRPVGRFVFSGFFNWYVPRLQAYGFVMSRRDEFEADADAAALCGPETMAEALVALNLRGRALSERAWPEIWRRALTDDTPPDRSWSTVTTIVREVPTDAERGLWLARALRRQALDDDTHPSLAERLRALGAISDGVADDPDVLGSRLLPVLTIPAAPHYLGSLAEEILATLDTDWRDAIAEAWRERHAELTTLRTRAEALAREDGEDGQLEPHEVWELACATTELHDEVAALPYLRRAAIAMPDLPPANFMLGRALLAAGDPAGEDFVRKAMALDVSVRRAGLELLRQHHANLSDRTAIEAVMIEQHSHIEAMQEAAAERSTVVAKDVLVPYTPTAKALEAIREAAAIRPRISEVWVARKVTRTLPERAMVVILITRRTKFWQWRGDTDRGLAQSVVDELAPAIDGDLMVFVLGSTTKWLLKKMAKLPDARVYAAQ